jgi:predicted dehydrogenase
MTRSKIDRRDFLAGTAATSAAGAALLGGVLNLDAASYEKVKGSNERIGVAFLGTGGRCQAHIGIITQLAADHKNVAPVAVCDVWDGNKEVEKFGRGLYPSAERCGLKADDSKHVTKDYRKVLELPEVDVVCIASPDHWHAKMTIDAAQAGKHVYCEKPMVKTIPEAQKVVDVMKQANKVMTVGVQSMANPTWTKAHEAITAGTIGHVMQGQTSYYRNSLVGQWRYYKLTKDMTPKTVDWDMFLGHGFSVFPEQPLGPKVPFDRAVYGQWRCYWPFGGGMFTDLFVHQTTHLISAMGVRYPARVVGGGGLYLEYDERDVPDVATVVADYDEGCQVIITATMCSRYPIEETIRGRLGTIKFVEGGYEVIADDPAGKAGLPARLEKSVAGKFVDCGAPDMTTNKNADTELLWQDFLKCVRDNNRETLSTPELGAAAFTTVAMGVESYRKGVALFWDRSGRKTAPADASWASRWEQRSKSHGKPNQVMGWTANDTGSTFTPPEYQKLAGAWKDGKDPAENS